MDLNVADTLVDVTNGLNYINNHPTFPITGNDATTGEPEPTKEKTLVWFPVDHIYHLTDGRFGFPKIPDARLAIYGITEATVLEWQNTFNITVVENGEDLLPVEEEEA